MKKSLSRSTRAEMGVGTLIVFIAMLLVAAIAAGVLITTVTSLQQKALTTGQETRGEISTHLGVMEVSALNGFDGDMENLSMMVKLSSGSDAIDLDDMLLSVSLNNGTSNLRLNASANWSDIASRSSFFNVTYEVTGPEHRDGFLVRGDVISMFFFPARDIIEDELLRITMIPKVGTQTLVEVRTPAVVSRETMFLFP